MAFNSMNSIAGLAKNRGNVQDFSIKSSTIINTFDSSKKIICVTGTTSDISSNIQDSCGNIVIYTKTARTLNYVIVGGGGAGGAGNYAHTGFQPKGGNGGDGGRIKTGSITLSANSQTTINCRVGGGGQVTYQRLKTGGSGGISSITVSGTTTTAGGGSGGEYGYNNVDVNNIANASPTTYGTYGTYGKGGRGGNNTTETDNVATGGSGSDISINTINYKFSGGGGGGNVLSNTTATGSCVQNLGSTGYGGGSSGYYTSLTVKNSAVNGTISTGGGGGGGAGVATTTNNQFNNDNYIGGSTSNVDTTGPGWGAYGGKGVIYFYF